MIVRGQKLIIRNAKHFAAYLSAVRNHFYQDLENAQRLHLVSEILLSDHLPLPGRGTILPGLCRAAALYCRAWAFFHLSCSSAVSLERSMRGARLLFGKALA